MLKKIKKLWNENNNDAKGWLFVMLLYIAATIIACVKGYSQAIIDCCQFVLIAFLFYENVKLNNIK